MQKIFRLRTCEDSVFSNRSRPCLLFQIKRCSGPCVGLIKPDDYANDVQLASMFLLGKQHEVVRRLNNAMEAASNQLAFEQAAVYRDLIQSLHQVQEKQFVSSSNGEDVDILVAIKEAGQLCVNLGVISVTGHFSRPMPGTPMLPMPARPSSANITLHIQHHRAYWLILCQSKMSPVKQQRHSLSLLGVPFHCRKLVA